jgi:hypothetical protein
MVGGSGSAARSGGPRPLVPPWLAERVVNSPGGNRPATRLDAQPRWTRSSVRPDGSLQRDGRLTVRVRTSPFRERGTRPISNLNGCRGRMTLCQHELWGLADGRTGVAARAHERVDTCAWASSEVAWIVELVAALARPPHAYTCLADPDSGLSRIRPASGVFAGFVPRARPAAVWLSGRLGLRRSGVVTERTAFRDRCCEIVDPGVRVLAEIAPGVRGITCGC